MINKKIVSLILLFTAVSIFAVEENQDDFYLCLLRNTSTEGVCFMTIFYSDKDDFAQKKTKQPNLIMSPGQGVANLGPVDLRKLSLTIIIRNEQLQELKHYSINTAQYNAHLDWTGTQLIASQPREIPIESMRFIDQKDVVELEFLSPDNNQTA